MCSPSEESKARTACSSTASTAEKAVTPDTLTRRGSLALFFRCCRDVRVLEYVERLFGPMPRTTFFSAPDGASGTPISRLPWRALALCFLAELERPSMDATSFGRRLA